MVCGTVCDGNNLRRGKTRAATDEAIAAYDQTVANYRETVLTGFQQAEERRGFAHPQHEAQIQEGAVVAAQKYLELAITRYKDSVTS